MTFDEYITNPMGKSNAVLSAAVREAQRKIYSTKFNNVLLRENGRIDYYMYKGKDGSYWIHIKVPSEVVNNFYYDVVMKFTASAGIAASAAKLDKYQVEFYSNDPAFVYTYAYVFLRKGLFIKELASKMSKKALRTPAKEKNPENSVGYVKSLYFAYLFMVNRDLFSKIKYVGAPDLDKRTLLSRIEDADIKVQKRQDEGEKISKKKQDTLSKSDYNKLKASGASDESLSGVKVATTKKVGVVKNTALNRSKTSNRTKSVKRF
jgi:hypothetical protein